MDYEKAYKEALERAKILYNDKNEIGYANAESVLEEVFPLLKESEDEKVRKEILQSIRDNMVVIHKDECIAWLEKQAEQKPTLRERYKNIAESEWFKKTHDGMSVSNDEEPKWTDGDEKIRKALIEYFNEQCDMSDWNGVYGYQVVAWLEKQGREKPADNVESKFKVGDWITDDEDEVIFHITSYDIDYGYQLETVNGTSFHYSDETIEKKYRLWTIADAKDGDVLTNGDFPCIFKRCDGNGSLYVYCGINAHNDFSILSEDSENIWDDYSKQYFPATKEQRDLLFQKMHEAGYEWDADEKELKKIEQKSQRMVSAEAKEAMYDKPACAWSEKDENVLEDIKEAIINYWGGDTQDILLDWLKSLKERYTWKPSIAQLNALSIVSKGNAPDDMEAIVSLYNDLKKLREE